MTAKLTVLAAFAAALIPAMGHAGTPETTAVETLSITRPAEAGRVSIGAAPAAASSLAPAGYRAVSAFRVHREGAASAANAKVALPQIQLRAAGNDPDLGVYVVSNLAEDGHSGRTGYWLHGATRDARGLTFSLPLSSLEPDQDVLLLKHVAPPRSDEYALRADPADTAPLGERVPVVLIHGYDGSISGLPFDLSRDHTFSKFVKFPGFRKLRPRVKFYRFQYRPYMALADLAGHFADALVREFGNSRNIVIVAHSFGGLVSRYATADARLTDRIPGIITVATPHHGSVSASILQANGNVAERLGRVNALLMKRSQKATADTPALRDLRIDNMDGRFGPQALTHYNLQVNSGLAAFNAADRNTGKIYAYMGEVHHLWGRYTLGIAGELHRRALAQFEHSWSTADPVVHLESGLFSGADVAARRVFRQRSHTDLLADAEVARSIFADVAMLARAARAAELVR